MLFAVESCCCHKVIASLADVKLEISGFFPKESAVIFCLPFILIYLYIFSFRICTVMLILTAVVNYGRDVP